MLKHNTCSKCQFPNSITSERQVFCVNCNKVLEGNYIDWKKANTQGNFNEYIHLFETVEEIVVEKKSLAKNTKIFLIASALQITFFTLIMVYQYNPLMIEYNAQNKDYLKEIKWNTKSITQEITLSVPFEFKPTASLLPCYLSNNFEHNTSYKAESSCESFSVTVEDIGFYTDFSINDENLISINDSYMQRSGENFSENRILDHFTIKKYRTYLHHGFYTLEGRNYIFDNYTLIKGDRAFKIIISYLQGDKLLNTMSESVSQSLLNNGIVS